MAADHDVVEHAHMMEQRKILEGAADPEAGPRVGLEPGDVAAAESSLPSVGGQSPDMQFMIDVLPAPFGPMIENSSPCRTAKLTAASTSTPPRRKETPCTSSACCKPSSNNVRPHRPQSVAAAGRTISDQRVFCVFAGLVTQPVRPRFRMRRARLVRRPTASQSRAPLLLSACAWDKSPAVATKLVRYGIVSRVDADAIR